MIVKASNHARVQLQAKATFPNSPQIAQNKHLKQKIKLEGKANCRSKPELQTQQQTPPAFQQVQGGSLKRDVVLHKAGQFPEFLLER